MRFQRTTISQCLSIVLLVTLCSSCSTSKRLNTKIIKSLKVQNKLITKVKKQRSSKVIVNETKKKKELQESEKSLLMALEAIRKSNKAVIEKLNQKNTKGDYINER